MDYRISGVRYLVCGLLAAAFYVASIGHASANSNVRIEARYIPSESRIVSSGGQSAVQQRWRLVARGGGGAGVVNTTYHTSGPTVMPDRQLARRTVRAASRFPGHPAILAFSVALSAANYFYDQETGELFEETEIDRYNDPHGVLATESPASGSLSDGVWDIGNSGSTSVCNLGSFGPFDSFGAALDSQHSAHQFEILGYFQDGPVHCWTAHRHTGTPGDPMTVNTHISFDTGNPQYPYESPALADLELIDPEAPPENAIWDDLGNVLTLNPEVRGEVMEDYFGTPDENWLDDAEYDWDALADTNVVEGWDMPLSDEEGEEIEGAADQFAEESGVDSDPAPDPDQVDDGREAADVMLEEFGDAPPPPGSTPTAEWQVEEYGPEHFDEQPVDWGADTCPEPITVNVAAGEFEISYQPLCDFADYVRFAFLAVAWLLAGWIVVVRSN